MTTRTTKNLVTIAAAVAITALVVGASIFLVSPGSKTITLTSSVTPFAGRLYDVVFKQSGECTPTAYEVPWAVTLGAWTVAEPSNASLPLDTSTGYTGPAFVNDSVIAFSVPNGQYQYKVTAISGFGNSTGAVDVNGADVMVLLEGPFTACTITTSTTASSTSTIQTGTAPSQGRLYEVTFRQMGSCTPTLFAGPWSVTLGNETIADPSNATLPAQGTASPQNPNDTITFSVPNGTYQYTVSPGVYFQPSSGVVDVDESDVEVVLQGPVTSCTAVVTTSSVSSVESVTGTSFTNASDTYLTSCSVTGIGGFQFLIVSDSTGAPVTGEMVNAVDRLGCDVVGQSGETQVIHLDNFSVGQGGWLTPVFPNQAEPGGELNITVTYQGMTYSFSATVPPIGTSCVTLHVPSGNVTRTTVMNGQGSYCWQ